ncbi:hypothetical protein EDB84DRAFT_229126 [Lactarius hengduanensis]|nr:hypothetical protein EDB84DRAFT_229126 [Lactarius hengduanensis]
MTLAERWRHRPEQKPFLLQPYSPHHDHLLQQAPQYFVSTDQPQICCPHPKVVRERRISPVITQLLLLPRDRTVPRPASRPLQPGRINLASAGRRANTALSYPQSPSTPFAHPFNPPSSAHHLLLIGHPISAMTLVLGSATPARGPCRIAPNRVDKVPRINWSIGLPLVSVVGLSSTCAVLWS